MSSRDAVAGEFATYFALTLEDALTERESRILSLRYGLVDGTPWTLQAIADEFGISRERVHQILTRVMRKLKYKRYTGKPGSAGSQLRDYLCRVLRPGEPGDMERLTTFIQDELAYLPIHTHIVPLLELCSAWIRATGASFSETDLVERVKERLLEQEAIHQREAKLERRQEAFQAFLDAVIIWPPHCNSVNLPLTHGRQREMNPASKGQVGVFQSEKLGRSVEYESQLEQQFLLRLEQSEDVVFYQEQPFRIPYRVDGHDRVYIPDVFFVLRDGRGVVAEIIPRHLMVLHTNLRKWPVLRDYCKTQGYGRLITDGRTGIQAFWQHTIPRPYADAVLAALSEGPLTWPKYETIREEHEATWNDFISLILQRRLVWSMQPFRLQLPDAALEKIAAHED